LAKLGINVHTSETAARSGIEKKPIIEEAEEKQKSPNNNQRAYPPAISIYENSLFLLLTDIDGNPFL
jgi:hypothetical protein